jgi:hypothetical protein
MRTIILTSIYLGSFMLFYLMLSLIALPFASYIDIISNKSWGACYALFIGWWAALLPTREYYMRNYHYFDKIF